MFVALGNHREMNKLHIVLCGLPGSKMFFHIIL